MRLLLLLSEINAWQRNRMRIQETFINQSPMHNPVVGDGEYMVALNTPYCSLVKFYPSA